MRSLRSISLFFFAILFMGLQASVTDAQSRTLVINSGNTSSEWQIQGEPTIVVNGFDLSPLSLNTPITIEAVTIAVKEPVNEAVQVVVYEDGNGGSPSDATLLYETSASILTNGVARIALPNPPTTSAPVIWVGFRLPVGFRFFADESGSSVLTYWAWTPNSVVGTNSLAGASVLGPSDGSAPVNIDLGGVARMTVEITEAGGTTGGTTSGTVLGQQIQSSTQGAPISSLQSYEFCGSSLLYDPADIQQSAQGAFTLHCRDDQEGFAPYTIRNEGQIPNAASSYERRGFMYAVFAAGNYQAASGDPEELRVPVTHCILPNPADVNQAFIGIAYGVPRAWTILPTQRYGDYVCAEVTHNSYIAYFVPRGETPNANIDLLFSGFPFVSTALAWQQDNQRLLCEYPYHINYSIRNAGFATSDATIVRVLLRNDRTGEISESRDYNLAPVAPGQTVDIFDQEFVIPALYLNESHTFELLIDPNNSVSETNNNNNSRTIGDIVVTERINGGCD